MAVQRLNAGVDFLKGGLRAEAQPDDAGGHPLCSFSAATT